MSRAKHRGHRPPGLFRWEQGQAVEELDEVPDNPKHRPCPACGAQRGEPCSRPSRNGGRQPLRAKPGDPLRLGFHPARAVIPETETEGVGDAGGQDGVHGPEPAAPEPDDPEPAPTPQQHSQPPQPPPTARAKADLRWAMNL